MWIGCLSASNEVLIAYRRRVGNTVIYQYPARDNLAILIMCTCVRLASAFDSTHSKYFNLCEEIIAYARTAFRGRTLTLAYETRSEILSLIYMRIYSRVVEWILRQCVLKYALMYRRDRFPIVNDDCVLTSVGTPLSFIYNIRVQSHCGVRIYTALNRRLNCTNVYLYPRIESI